MAKISNPLAIPASRFYRVEEPYTESGRARRNSAKQNDYARRTRKIYPPRYNDDRTECYVEDWPEGWRDLGDAHEIATFIRHTGWYTDPWGDAAAGLMRGRVLQLPGRNGEPIYVPATYHTDWDSITLYLKDLHHDKTDAATRADHYAEIAAQEEKEFQVKEMAELRIEELQEEVKTTRRTCLTLLREMKGIRTGGGHKTDSTPEKWTRPAICGVLREKIRSYLDDIRKARETIEKLKDNPWTLLEV